MSVFQANPQHQTVSEHVVSVTYQRRAEGRYRWEVGEELGQPGWSLLQQEMEEAPVRERSKGERAGSCRPCYGAGRPGSVRLEEKEEEEKGRELSGQGIYDQRH